MSPLQLIINATLTMLLPLIIGGVYWHARALAQRLPEHQRAALEQFARMAVHSVEQQYTKNPGKKALAEAAIADLFASHRLPVPSKKAIDIAIEAAVFALRSFAGE